MNCEVCKKQLQGGFQQESGGFQCADCVIAKVEIDSAIRTNDQVFKSIIQCLDIKASGRKYKAQVIEIKEALISARQMTYWNSENLHKMKSKYVVKPHPPEIEDV